MSGVDLGKNQFQENLLKLRHSFGIWQQKAWDRVWEIGMPKFPEHVRYLKLRELYAHSLLEATNPHLSKQEVMKEVPEQSRESCIVYVNGEFREDLSSLKGLPKGVLALSFSAAMAPFGAFLSQHLTKMLKEEKDPFALLNLALYKEGAFLYVPPHTILKDPICVLNWVENANGFSLFSPRIHLFAGKSSSVEVLFKQKSQEGSSYWVNGFCEATLEEKAKVKWTSFCNESKEAWNFLALRSQLRREAEFNHLSIGNGGHAVCQDYRVALAGEKSEASLYGMWMMGHARQAYVNVVMEHQEPHSRSLQKFKSILNGASRSSFQGKIVVAPKALKTEAFQVSNALLLSDKAIASSKPMLEVLADDVKASHGATVGQLDAEQLFYLKTRGLPENIARKLLMLGFCSDILDLISFPSLKNEAALLSQQCLEG